MRYGTRLYKLYPDGSGEMLAEFQYPGHAALFMNAVSMTDFLSLGPDEEASLTLTVIDVETGSLLMGRELTHPAPAKEE